MIIIIFGPSPPSRQTPRCDWLMTFVLWVAAVLWGLGAERQEWRGNRGRRHSVQLMRRNYITGGLLMERPGCTGCAHRHRHVSKNAHGRAPVAPCRRNNRRNFSWGSLCGEPRTGGTGRELLTATKVWAQIGSAPTQLPPDWEEEKLFVFPVCCILTFICGTV